MLNKVAWQKTTRVGDPQVAGAEEPLIDLGEAFRVLRRRRVLVASILALAVSGAVVYLAMHPARYIASSMLLFDVRKNEPFQQQGYPNAAANLPSSIAKWRSSSPRTLQDRSSEPSAYSLTRNSLLQRVSRPPYKDS